MKKSILLILILVFIMPNWGFANNVTLDSLVDYNVNRVICKLKQVIERNELNLKNGKGYKNRYLISINLNDLSVPCDNDEEAIFRNPSFSGYFTDLEEELCDFNGANSYDIVNYGLMIWTPDNANKSEVTADLEATNNVPAFFTDYEAGANMTSYEHFISSFTNKLGLELDNTKFGQAKEKMITAMIMSPARTHYLISQVIPNKWHTHVYTYYVESQFLNPVRIDNYLNYAKTTDYGLLGEYRPFYTRIKGFIEYFSIPQLDNISCPDIKVTGSSIAETTIFANDFIQCKCSGLNTDQKNFLLAVAQTVHDIFAVIEKENWMFECNSPNNSNYWYFNIIDQFIDSGQTDWLDWLLKNRIMAQNLSEVNIGDISVFMKYASVSDLQKLNNSERIKIIDVIRETEDPWTLNSPSYGKMYTLYMEAILRTAKFKSADTITVFIDDLKKNSRIQYLWERMNQFFVGDENEEKLINTLTDLATKAGNYDHLKIFIDDYNDKTYMWKVGEWFSTNNVGYWKYDNISVNSDNSVTWRCGVNYKDEDGEIKVDYEHGPGNNGVSTFSDPFEMVAIGYPNEMSFFTDCDNGLGCKGSGRIMPAIAFAFHADKYNEQLIKDAAWDIFNGVLFAVGVGEFMTALRAGNIAKAVLLGYSSFWEFNQLLATQSVVENVIYNNFDPAVAQTIVDKYKVTTEINGAMAGGLILGDQGLKFICGYFSAKKIGGIADELGEMLLNNADNALETRPDIVTKLSKKYNIENCADNIRNIPANEGKSAILGLVAARGEDVQNILNSSPDLINVINKIQNANPEVNKVLLAMDDSTFARWLNEIKDGNLIEESILNPDMLKAWKYLDDAGVPRC